MHTPRGRFASIRVPKFTETRSLTLTHTLTTSSASGRFREAIDAWSKAISAGDATEEELPILYSNRSAAYLQIDQADKAEADAQQACFMRPTWAKAHARQGAALVSLGRHTEAANAYARAAEVCPCVRVRAWRCGYAGVRGAAGVGAIGVLFLP